MSAISNICQPDLRSIIQSVISRFLYREEINNMCGTNRYLNELFLEDWRYVYRICLHIQPHNYDGLAIIGKTSPHQWRWKPNREGEQPAIIYRNGTQSWYKEGKVHRDGDQPAIIYEGCQEWWKEGKRHREGGQPALISVHGTLFWYKEGKRHREGDQPAVINANGDQGWYKEGKCHRDGDQPAIIRADGDQEWYKEGKLHREGDQPAMISWNGIQLWYKEGRRFVLRNGVFIEKIDW